MTATVWMRKKLLLKPKVGIDTYLTFTSARFKLIVATVDCDFAVLIWTRFSWVILWVAELGDILPTIVSDCWTSIYWHGISMLGQTEKNQIIDPLRLTFTWQNLYLTAVELINVEVINESTWFAWGKASVDLQMMDHGTTHQQQTRWTVGMIVLCRCFGERPRMSTDGGARECPLWCLIYGARVSYSSAACLLETVRWHGGLWLFKQQGKLRRVPDIDDGLQGL